MKTHLNLAASDLSASVSFYSVLLDVKPIKERLDYALFIAEQPGLELALDRRTSVIATTDAHYGISVASAEDVERAIRRLEGAGLVSSVEREETCCYANQTKVWALDPDGRRWEIYTVHEDRDERDSADTTCCRSDEGRVCGAA
jgi:catechol 2,3-dioxygenase-like lactoylglutathione lyase family enzyme